MLTFNLHRAVASEFYESEGLLIVADIIDAIAVHASGNTNVVAVMGGQVTAQQILRLKRLANATLKVTLLVGTRSDALLMATGELATFAWVRVAVSDRDVPIHGLEDDAIQAMVA